MARLELAGIGEYIREQRNAAQLSLRQLAAAAEVSNPYLSQVERGLRKPSAEILYRIAQGLRISAETLYVRAGILDADSSATPTATALRIDESLTDSQRQTLLELYANYQAENSAAGTAPSSGSVSGSITGGLNDAASGRVEAGARSETPETKG